MEKGTYVLATKYTDGDSKDPFCIGLFDRMYKDRFVVVDSDGGSFRANGFRRCEEITEEEGRHMVSLILEIEVSDIAVFDWLRYVQEVGICND